MKLSLIVAISQNHVIGNQGKLPWHIPEDLKRFRTITQGHPVIMGRKTFESIGRLLPNRQNIIVSRKAGFEVEGATVFSSLDKALGYCEEKPEEVFVIGGGEIYSQSLSKVNRMYITQIHSEIEGDAFFPKWDDGEFSVSSREDHPAGENHPPYTYFIFDRK